MATNKNAQLRYQVLDRCFSDFHRRFFIEDLLESINEKLQDLYGTEVSERQVRDDIKYMRDRVTYNAPIEAIPYQGRKCYYRYSDPDFSIFKNELSVEDLTKLRATIDMLGKYRSTSANGWLEEVVSSLEYRFGVKSNPENLISFDHNEQLIGLEYLSDIIDATVNHQTLDMSYRSYKGEERRVRFHPYFVKQYNARWFVFGLDEEFDRIMNMALDRIQSLNLSKVTFRSNEKIDFDSYFKDVIGVTIPNDDVKKEDIKLKFTPERFPYVVSKPLHHSQQIIEGEEYTITLSVKPTRELEQQLFSFGPDVEVISPPLYRAYLQKKIEKTMKKYLSAQRESNNDIEYFENFD